MGGETKYQAAILLSAVGNRGATGVPGSEAKCAVCRFGCQRFAAMSKRCDGVSIDGFHEAEGKGR
ncbi:hypothetical protein EDD53_1819 [Pacificibacter maritimus]|uniref:Uncharacterized protein n=1 Tax=Pacificibacter maritimus TaxID=762213 RepID=A0A3N4V0P3_9RHOB|nr:hypothetical protein EDD53_1819 [Pacificibacter maritimus]